MRAREGGLGVFYLKVNLPFKKRKYVNAVQFLFVNSRNTGSVFVISGEMPKGGHKKKDVIHVELLLCGYLCILTMSCH